MSETEPPNTGRGHSEGNDPTAFQRHHHGEVDHEKKATTEVASGERLVGNGIHFGFFAHVWKERIVEHASPVEANVGHHEHDERPNPTRRYAKVGREGQKNTGN